MDEIEEFLRQAAARRNRPQQPAQQPPAQQPPAQQPPAQQRPPQQRPPQQQRPVQRPRTGTQYVPPQPPRLVPQQPPQTRQLQPSITGRQIDTSSFDQRSSQMGAKERMADERTDARLQERFAHTISDLAGASAPIASAYDDQDVATFSQTTQEAPIPANLNIASLFRSPANIQQAIILNEILQRPDHRW